VGSEGTHQVEEAFVYNGHLAVDCLPYDTTDANMIQVKQVDSLLHAHIINSIELTVRNAKV
jgi:hypothetical protein